ncbi:GyrI-like domain-containing protein [Bacteroides timonensis]|uniref:GyrI-like domain-containing protein n=1 Tax=Bacteroides timonensis TaxID=1470345 RepID=UPI0004AD137E|nr:GyrI-like domain-containing protein [Bacteroides timonensis]
MKEETTYGHQELINQAIDYIHNHLHQTLSSEMLAMEMNMSVYHFHRLFKSYLSLPCMWRIIGPHGEESGSIGSLTIENGPYVVYTYRGSYKGLLRTYTHIYSKEKERLRNALSFEEYVTWSKDPSEQITKIYIPIRLNQ